MLLLFLCQFIFSGSGVYAAENEVSTINKEPVAKERIAKERIDFANNFANAVLAIISDQKKSYDARKEILERAFSNSVDIDWIAKFVIGRSWNKANDEQRERYTALYRKFLTKSYVENFATNPDKRISSIKILAVNENDTTASDFTVVTKINLTNNDELNVNYLVREKEGRYKVLDIAIENVSLINTHRAEFSALAIARGVDGVITKLDQLINQKSAITISMNQ